MVLSGGSEGETSCLSRSSWWLLAILGVSRLVAAKPQSLPPSSPCVCVPCSSYEDASHWIWGPPPIQDDLILKSLNKYTFEDPFPNKFTVRGSGGMRLFGGHYIAVPSLFLATYSPVVGGRQDDPRLSMSCGHPWGSGRSGQVWADQSWMAQAWLTAVCVRD